MFLLFFILSTWAIFTSCFSWLFQLNRMTKVFFLHHVEFNSSLNSRKPLEKWKILNFLLFSTFPTFNFSCECSEFQCKNTTLTLMSSHRYQLFIRHEKVSWMVISSKTRTFCCCKIFFKIRRESKEDFKFSTREKKGLKKLYFLLLSGKWRKILSLRISQVRK